MFLNPYATLHPGDGQCFFGLRQYAALPLLGFDIFFNILLTLVFIYLLGPGIRSNITKRSSASRLVLWLFACCWLDRGKEVRLQTGNPKFARRLEKLLWRTFMGSCLVLLTTVANIIQMVVVEGRESGYLCLTLCALDGMFMVSSLFCKALIV